MRRFLLALAAAGLMAGAAQAAPPNLPSHEVPNGAGDIVVPFALSTPPAVREQRSYQQLLSLWRDAGGAYGVPWEVLAAINKIESDFGRNMGPSSAGALGWMQFIPSTWARWGLDANGDGVANPWNPEDAVYAAARYLAAAGAQDDLSRAIFAYNHAQWYVNDVLELAGVFSAGGGFDAALGSSTFSGTAGPQLVFQIDDIERRLVKARRAVNRAQRAVLAAEQKLADNDAALLAAETRAGDPELSDDEFLRLEEEVTQLVLAQEGVAAELDGKRIALDEAIRQLDDLRREAEVQASAVTFSRPLVNSLGGPQFAGNYVFPVGGGPEVVSVAATHHDYPAADIAAPEGAPLYALADSFVVYSNASPTGRCGIGFKLQLADGTNYVYCHLSYLEPEVVEGAALTAGTPVGLVGSTGNSTSPHLHLQFSPAEAYPQQEPWFKTFAGLAFRWQGDPAPAPTSARSTSNPVFDVVDDSVVSFTG
ncbi:MAG: lytic murein transglycosylase [Actinobacteria bacterium]|nr:lytic murein transglycosylase [Actinomycetota bacterium]